MSSIKKLIEILEKKRAENGDFTINLPSIWLDEKCGKEAAYVEKEAYGTFIQSLKEIEKNVYDYSLPYYRHHGEEGRSGDWIKSSVIYSMLPRYSSALNPEDEEVYKKYGFSYKGSFLKSLLYLKKLNYMGVDTVYLLPVMQRSGMNRKGDAGSCYAISDFFSLDGELKDDITGVESSVDLEFAAFVEAAHSYGMKVVIDIIPRTAARDNVMIFDHPDFFYWIKKQDLNTYRPPSVPLQIKMEAANISNLSNVFKSSEVIEHIKKFESNPLSINPELYAKIKSESSKSDMSDFLRKIEEEFGLIVAPAFSDCINDTQAPWADITYLRLYLDHPEESQKYLSELGLNPNPYILYDVAKASNLGGTQPNYELWNKLADIIPHYQKKYGIDGVRIDMGHALPKELLKMIMERVKENDEHFCFIAEELDIKRAKLSKEAGYNAIVGDAFIKFNDLDNNGYIEYLKSVESQPLPILSCIETHDTKRLAADYPLRRRRAEAITYAGLFIPNSVGFINTMQEIFELQPMNLGIGLSDKDLYRLNKNNRNYGKLALFDYCAPTWENSHLYNMLDELHILSAYRKKYIAASEVKLFFFEKKKTALTIFVKDKQILIVVCNSGKEDEALISWDMGVVKKGLDKPLETSLILSSTKRKARLKQNKSKFSLMLKPMETVLFELTY